MSKKNLELMRVQNLIEIDRLKLGDGFEKLFQTDLSKLLNDYFEIKACPKFTIEKTIRGYNVNIGVEALTIKNVNFLP